MQRLMNPGRRTACCLVPALLLLVQSGHAPAVDEIVARYVKAMGGLEKLRTWRAMKATGRYVLVAEGGTEVPFTVWYLAPDKTRMEIGAGREAAIYAFDGRTAWFCNPAAGRPDPSPMPDEQATDIRSNADQYPLVDYKAKGYRVDLLGTEDFEGARVHTLKLTRANGSESIHYLDVATGRELRILILSRRNGSEVVHETIERDFRRIDWLLLPFEVESRINGRVVRKMLIQAAEILPGLDGSLFEMPKGSDPRTPLASGGGAASREPQRASASDNPTRDGSPQTFAAAGEAERAAMKRLAFLIGNWEGEGWIEVGGGERRTFSVVESYRYRSGEWRRTAA